MPGSGCPEPDSDPERRGGAVPGIQGDCGSRWKQRGSGRSVRCSRRCRDCVGPNLGATCAPSTTCVPHHVRARMAAGSSSRGGCQGRLLRHGAASSPSPGHPHPSPEADGAGRAPGPLDGAGLRSASCSPSIQQPLQKLRLLPGETGGTQRWRQAGSIPLCHRSPVPPRLAPPACNLCWDSYI